MPTELTPSQLDPFLALLAALATDALGRDERWCLVRWHTPTEEPRGPQYCGPLSWLEPPAFDLLGFPGGYIGDLATFQSAAEATAAVVQHKGCVDLPTPLAELHFFTKVYSYWDGKSVVLYDGGHFERARATYLLFRGWADDRRYASAYRCTVECRAAPVGIRTPVPAPPEAT